RSANYTEFAASAHGRLRIWARRFSPRSAAPESELSFPFPVSLFLDSELPQMMIHVAIDQHPPLLRRELPERRMCWGQGFSAALDDSVQLFSESSNLRAPVAGLA